MEGDKKRMPIGKPSAQTIASKKYQSKAGYISKSYKLKREVADAFAGACEASGVSQAAKITELMRNYIESVDNRNENN